MNKLSTEKKIKIFNKRWAGARYGKLVILEFHKDLGKEKEYLCKCDCGNTKLVNLSSLRHYGTDRCSKCMTLKVSDIRTKVATKYSKLGVFVNPTVHGECNTTFYSCWAGMKSRCNNPQHECYEGVTYCKAWREYKNFKKDMFSTYFKHAVLDRIQHKGNYSKNNCQWLTKSDHGTKTRLDNHVNSVFNRSTI